MTTAVVPASSTVKNNGRRSSGMIEFVPHDDMKPNRCSYFNNELHVYQFIVVFSALTLPIVFLFFFAVQNDLSTQCSGDENSTKWTTIWFAILGLCIANITFGIFKTKMLRCKDMWAHTVVGLLVVIVVVYMVALHTLDHMTKAQLLIFWIATSVCFTVTGSISRRIAQFYKLRNMQRFLQNVVQEFALGLMSTSLAFMSTLYLIASERTSGIWDVFLNGVLYPLMVTSTKTFLHRHNKKSLERKQLDDHENVIELAGATSCILVRYHLCKVY